MSPSHRSHTLVKRPSFPGRMKPPVRLLLGLLLASLAAPAAQAASTIKSCDDGDWVVYYVVVTGPPSNLTSIPDTPWAYNASPPNLPFPQEPRIFEEFFATPVLDLGQAPPLYAVCSGNTTAFEDAHGIETGAAIGGGSLNELFTLLDDSTGAQVGVVWHDKYEPFDQGGGIIGQSYWSCGGRPTLDNFAYFSSGLDASAINGVSKKARSNWMARLRARVGAVEEKAMEVGKGCTAYADKAAFLAAVAQHDDPPQIWFRNGDPLKGDDIEN